MFVRYLAILTILGTYIVIAAPIALNKIVDATEPSASAPPTTLATRRTLFNVTWNCISTIFICAWVSIHPNVPPSGKWRALKRRLKTMFWAIIAPELILAWTVRQWSGAWEIMEEVKGSKEGLFAGIIRSMKGLLTWGKSEQLETSTRWTMEHGHLLLMGGISTVDPDFEVRNEKDPRGPVFTIDRYRELSEGKDGALFNLKLRKISVEDIKDQSKGDFLSKLIAILQTTWFILQCAARGQQRLALTELELVTLALASLNAVTYAFWWHKPLGVQEPIRIYFKIPERDGQDGHTTSDEPLGISVYYVISQVGKLLQFLARIIPEYTQDLFKSGRLFPLFLPFFILVTLFTLFLITFLSLFVPFPLGILFLLKILKTRPVAEPPSTIRGLLAARIVLTLQKLRYRLTSSVANVSENWMRKQLDDPDGLSCSGFFIGWLLLLPLLFFSLLAITLLLLPFFTFLYLLSFIFTAVFGIITSNTVAPGATHVPSFYSPSTNSDKYSRMIVFAFFGVLFGGLHCAGWNFTYPTPFEQHLWRATSLAITVIPFIVAPIDYILENFKLDEGWLRVVRITLDFIMTLFLFIYVPARLSLIAQALALLRHQPDAAFLAVDWTKYIPHIF